MYSFQPNGIAKSAIPKLVAFYTRQKLELRNDGVPLDPTGGEAGLY